MNQLNQHPSFKGAKGPVILAILDGVGIGGGDAGDIVAKAATPNLDWLKQHAVSTQLRAHGRAVGMPSDDDMGNSEVGHNAIGSGRVFDQGALLVQNAVRSGAMFQSDVWHQLVSGPTGSGGTFHFIGLLSDGNVHSHIDILLAMLSQAQTDGVRKVRLHVLLDGRDVPPQSAQVYIAQLEAHLAGINSTDGFDYRIASGGGRLYITMDRYGADWPMVKRGWDAHVKGVGRPFETAQQAIETLRADDPGCVDQDLKEFVIVEEGKPIGPIVDGDSVVLFNYRGDRAMEIAQAFDEPDLDTFERGTVPDVYFAGIMEYDADQQIPKRFLVTPPEIENPLAEYLVASGVRQLAVSETQKYGHVTYFFNGNRSDKFSEELEDYVEIKSDQVPFDQRPWMKAAEITDVMIDSIKNEKHDFIRANFPNGDMVGHTGDVLAVEISVEAVDLCIGRLVKELQKKGGFLIVTADHGNADEMYALDKKGVPKRDEKGALCSKTSHTLNPVPCYIYAAGEEAQLALAGDSELGISSLAATVIECLGFSPPDSFEPSIIQLKDS
ncbi:MAG: 2,3-bisphosphoglycerate-independent phosphoglycerate mutase [Mariniblastus sp.]|nr:2,3-bisphosphoglycerate-independent phosphoglycerate mutase [Mariniblastus sp.]